MKETVHFANPKSNLLQMGLHEGMKIGDFGTGSGHYALSASVIVGESGRVYAVDVQQDVLAHVREEAHTRKLRNIETIWGNVEKAGGTLLKDHALDAVILSNTLFQLEKRKEAIAEIRRVLKHSGKLLVLDWAGAYGGIGPSDLHVVSEQEAEALFIEAGFHKVKAFRGGPHHYAILFESP